MYVTPVKGILCARIVQWLREQSLESKKGWVPILVLPLISSVLLSM